MARAAPVVDTQTALTATANGSAIPAPVGGAAPKVGIFIDVTVATGTNPTLDITVEYSLNGGSNWAADEAGADSFAQITADGESFKVFDVKAARYRLVYAIGGTTPSFTLTVRHYGIG